jgi:4-hydroxybenzoate polyprenyltransferase
LAGKIARYFPLIMLLFFATTAAFALWAGAYLLGVPPKIEHIVTWWCIVFGVYGINRYTDIEDSLNDSSKRTFFINKKRYLRFSILILIGSMLWLLAAGSLTLYHIICVYSGIAYSVPLFPWLTKKFELKWLRLKEVALVKSLLVSLIIGTSFFALYFTNANISVGRTEILALMIGSALSMFINTIFCDIRDIVGDKAAGIKTIPVLLNVRNTLIFSFGIPSGIWLISLCTLWSLSLISIPVLLFLLCIIMYPVFYIGLYMKKMTSERVAFLIADACVPVFAVGLIILKEFVK